MKTLRGYGEGPLHLLSTLASLALAAYACTRIFDGVQAMNVVVWFVGAIVLHDVIGFPLYAALDRVALGRGGGPVVNYVRVPVILSAIALLVYFPLILGLSGLEHATTLSTDVYLGRWLLITGALFVGSGLLYAVRGRRAATAARS